MQFLFLAINGFVMINTTEVYIAKENDIISLVFNENFDYEVRFEDDNGFPMKRPSQEDLIGDVMTKRPKQEVDNWTSIENNKCLVFTSKNVLASEKIAAYDMDNTLIKTVSGNVFPKSIDDWQLNMPDVAVKLKKLNENGFKIVVFTNQAGIEGKRVTIDDVKKKIKMIQQRIDVPMQFFIATGSTIYRKPRTGMWKLLEERFNDGVKIDISASFYCGDAAGRPENKIVKRKKDHSCADRLFAMNLNLNFYTPEEHFLRMNSSLWTRPEFNPKSISETMSLLEPQDAKLKLNEQELIILVGFPGSGKSHFCKTHLKGYEIINRDTLNSMQKCISAIESALQKGKSCAVDNTNPDLASRRKFLDIAKNMGIKVRCFVMNTSYHHSRHNNVFRELTDSSHQKISDIVFNTYKTKYVEPKLSEGFFEIVKVNCVPNIENAEMKKLYQSYLLEK